MGEAIQQVGVPVRADNNQQYRKQEERGRYGKRILEDNAVDPRKESEDQRGQHDYTLNSSPADALPVKIYRGAAVPKELILGEPDLRGYVFPAFQHIHYPGYRYKTRYERRIYKCEYKDEPEEYDVLRQKMRLVQYAYEEQVHNAAQKGAKQHAGVHFVEAGGKDAQQYAG